MGFVQGKLVNKSVLLATTALIVAVGLGILVVLLRQPDQSAVVRESDFALAADDPQLGRRVYVRCQACHGIQGEGVAGNYPSLVGSARLGSDAAISLVLDGAARGPTWNGQMPPFADELADHEIAAVLTWARQQWGTPSPVAAADVARHRH